MKRLILAVAIAAAAVPAAACSPTPNQDERPADTTAPFEAAAVKDTCADGGILAMMRSAGAEDPMENQLVCGDLQRGQNLAVLSQPDRLVWDRQCVEANGYKLTQIPNGPERPTSSDPHDYAPQEVAHCATPKFTPEQCAQIQTGLGAIDSGPDVRGIVMSEEEAAVLHRLGCPIPQVVRHEQAGIAESQR